ncbi:uncharacterized protein SCODWIG_01412 [Saccharomycodes ludwigii]|uniref:VPS4-associated protein 1 n=1 Tax=Saccharomycodes ludwigii TaxID=36035 RepID=A0A376B4T1_9ASCO|nr:hypothetical protein SCDLUD_001422 [Saccharomycodes ludwigii]KAH3901653.1 hypothetical protein SCDLUD_001422 [Saccharomycodes ludwigii]SSD59651.1 uncharacterized protein SCODWIG_01412 [Saccharomycodes ludwigii]
MNKSSDIYVKRKVAKPEPCLICYKPTSTVMFNENFYQQQYKDWFYCCDLHFIDNPSFMKPAYSQEYYHTLELIKELEPQIMRINKNNKSGTWDNWINKYLYNDNNNKTSSKTKDKDQGKEKDENREKDSEKKSEDSEKMTEEQELINKYKNLKLKSDSLKLNNKQYQLNKIMYNQRLTSLMKTLTREQQQSQNKNDCIMTSKSDNSIDDSSYTDPNSIAMSFPKVPSHNPL